MKQRKEKFRLNVILSEEAAEIALRYKGVHKWKSKTEMANEAWRLLDRYQKALEMALQKQQKEPEKEYAVDELPECKRRIFFKGAFYCVHTSAKGFVTKKKLEPVEICKVCRLEKLRIPESTKVKSEETIRDPDRKHIGMIYCDKGGRKHWVFENYCETLCKDRSNCIKYAEWKSRSLDAKNR